VIGKQQHMSIGRTTMKKLSTMLAMKKILLQNTISAKTARNSMIVNIGAVMYENPKAKIRKVRIMYSKM